MYVLSLHIILCIIIGLYYIYINQGIAKWTFDDTNWNKIKQDKGDIDRISLKICSKRLLREFRLSLTKRELPLIPIVLDEDTKCWPDYLKFVEIESHGIYIGIRYGYDHLHLIVIIKWLCKELPNELPIELTSMVIHYYMDPKIKSFILEPVIAMKMAASSLPFQDMKKYNKWVTDIEIRDFDHEIEEIARRFSIDLASIKRCFNENAVDYSWLGWHSRKQFTELLSNYGVNAGPATKVYRILYQKQEIEILK